MLTCLLFLLLFLLIGTIAPKGETPQPMDNNTSNGILVAIESSILRMESVKGHITTLQESVSI